MIYKFISAVNPRQTAEEDFTPAGGRDESPILPVNLRELTNIIKTELNAKKAPGYDLITGKVIKELLPKH